LVVGFRNPTNTGIFRWIPERDAFASLDHGLDLVNMIRHGTRFSIEGSLRRRSQGAGAVLRGLRSLARFGAPAGGDDGGRGREWRNARDSAGSVPTTFRRGDHFHRC
jgi:hypothetical protein